MFIRKSIRNKKPKPGRIFYIDHKSYEYMYTECIIGGIPIRLGTKLVDRKKNLYRVTEIYFDSVIIVDETGEEYCYMKDELGELRVCL